MPLRVLLLDAGREWRGGQRQVWLLAQGLRARGYEPLVACPPDAPLLHRLHAAGIATSAVPMRADWDLRAARRVRLLIRAWRPDLVHAHDARSHAVGLTALVRRREIPLVVTRRVPYPHRGRLKYGKRVARFIAISRAVRDALMAGGVEPERIETVYSGVPRPPAVTPRDWRRECRWPSEAVLCGVVGAMTHEKGTALLAAIGERIAPAIRGRLRLLLLGGRAAGRRSIGGIDAFAAGFVDEVHAAMAGLDLLWHPSSAEGLGTAVIDAMALGVPPVAFAVGGLVELIEDGTTGVLVPPGDLDAFARAVERLVEDPDRRQALARRGPSRAALFDVDRMVDGTVRVYASLVAGIAEPDDKARVPN